MNNPIFFNRDISWLSFDERVRQEAGKAAVPSRVFQIPIHLQ
jgi:polyphosphate kinase